MLSEEAIEIVVIVTIFTALAILAVGLRLSARRAKSPSLAADDYLIVAALIVVAAGSAGSIAGAVVGGTGFHFKGLKHSTHITLFKFIYALQFTYLLAVTLIKLSILTFYRRIFVTKGFRTAVNIIGIIVILWFITFFFATLLQKIPISNNWPSDEHLQPSGQAVNNCAMYVAAAVMEMLLDVMTLVLPMFVIWNLHMRPNQKWQLSGIFLLGTFVCIASVLRLYYLILHLNPTTEEEVDLSYNIGNVILWSAIEPCVGTICACLPTLAPVFQRRFLESILQSFRNLFTIQSNNDSGNRSSPWVSRKPVPPIGRNEAENRLFYPLNDEQSLITTARSQRESERDLEDLPLQNIIVNSTIETKVELRGS